MVFLAASDTSQRIAQATVLDELDAFSEKSRISINGAPAPNPNEVLRAVKTLKWLRAHHSSPTKEFKVEVSDDSHQIVLWLARYSRNPREYWIFDPRNLVTRSNEIGRIVTPVFDSYQ